MSLRQRFTCNANREKIVYIEEKWMLSLSLDESLNILRVKKRIRIKREEKNTILIVFYKVQCNLNISKYIQVSLVFSFFFFFCHNDFRFP